MTEIIAILAILLSAVNTYTMLVWHRKSNDKGDASWKRDIENRMESQEKHTGKMDGLRLDAKLAEFGLELKYIRESINDLKK